MSDPVRIPPRVPDQPRIPDEASERRLFEIRREGENKGVVKGAGVRPSGAPFPVASVETGYYGIPLLKEPAWTWEIPLYFFVGGAAGSAAVVGAIANYTVAASIFQLHRRADRRKRNSRLEQECCESANSLRHVRAFSDHRDVGANGKSPRQSSTDARPRSGALGMLGRISS